MLCTHKTTSSASLVLKFVLKFNNSYLNQFSSISGGNCIKTPLRLPEQQIGSEQVNQQLPRPVSTELGEFFQSFKVPLQPSNELKIMSHSNLSSTTLILDKHSSTVSTTNTGLVYLTRTLWRPASTHTLKTVLSQKNL